MTRYNRAWRTLQVGKKPRACALKHSVKYGRFTIHLTDEGLEQFIVCRWLESRSVFFIAVPNGGKSTKFNRLMAQALGERAGASDLLIFDSPPRFPKFKGVAIEMKSKVGNATPTQLLFQEEMDKRGWLKAICQGSDEAIKLLEACGY